MVDTYRQQGNPVDERTPALDLPLPHLLNDTRDDVPRLRAALGLIDAAHMLLADNKADKAALQAFALATADAMEASEQATANEVAKLAVQLATQTQQLGRQISDMGKALDAKRIDLQAVAAASTAAQARAGSVAERRLRQAHINTSNAPSGVLQPGTEYSVYAPAWTEGWTLPAAPQIGDQIVLLDSWNTWGLRTFAVKRGEASHHINNRAEDVRFNLDVWRVKLTYVWTDKWTLSIG